MASENTQGYLTFDAGADLSAKQYYIVKIVTTDETVDVAGAGELAIGVLQNKPESGQAATVSRAGDITKVSAGAAFALGVKLAADSAGQAVLATTGDNVIGVSTEAAGAGDEIVEMVQTHGGIAA